MQQRESNRKRQQWSQRGSAARGSNREPVQQQVEHRDAAGQRCSRTEMQ